MFDWSRVRVRLGEWCCPDHGVVPEGEWAPVPCCPHCGGVLLQAVRDRRTGHQVYAEPAPATCAGPDRHRLGSGTMTLGWYACACRGLGEGHRLWRCNQCGDEQAGPPCTNPDPHHWPAGFTLGGASGRFAS